MTNEINRMTEVKISEVLHLAADEYLAEDFDYNWELKDEYSCLSIAMACEELSPQTDRFFLYKRICVGLKEMGLDKKSGSQFDEFCVTIGEDGELTPNKASQGARYTWLKFAAMIAEEQGV